MKSRDYWKKRFREIEESSYLESISYIEALDKEYRKAAIEIEKEINNWYQRFAKNNDISITEAKKMLNATELKELKWSVEDYIKYGQENAIDSKWMKQLENASARFHISRLDALKLSTQQSIEKLYGNQLDDIDNLMKGTFKNNYYKTAFEIQKGLGVGSNFSAIDEKKLNKIISKPWSVDGKNFSERIWGNKNKLINELHSELTQMCVLGNSPEKTVKSISKKMNVSLNRSRTLVMTESAYFQSIADCESMKKIGVKKYEILATLDSLTSNICQEMDGKVFGINEFEVGSTAPPFHPNCRTVEVPYFDEEENIPGERAARDGDGQTYYVPSNMKYSEWKEKFVYDLNRVNIYDKMKNKDDWIGLDFENSLSKTDAIMNLKNTYGIDFKDSKKYPIEESIITDCVSWLNSFSEQYPDFMEMNPCKIPLIVNYPPSKMKNTLGYYSYYTTEKVKELALNGIYHSSEQYFKDYLKKAIDSKWTVQNANTRHTFVHEFGHHVSHAMQHIFKNRNWERVFIRECIEEFKEIEPNYKYNTYIGMGDYVSRYAATSESELFAEAFSEYFGNSNPRTFAKIFGKKLEVLLKGVK